MTQRRWILGGLAAAGLAAAAGVHAQAVSAGDGRAASGRASEPAIERLVVEDDATRIEELRVRGQTQRVVVRPKGERGAVYEIVIVPPGRADPSTGPGANRGAGGQRVWSVMNF
jgi:hypothetical protein